MALLISCEVAPLPDASVSAGNTGVVDGGVSRREEVSSGATLPALQPQRSVGTDAYWS